MFSVFNFFLKNKLSIINDNFCVNISIFFFDTSSQTSHLLFYSWCKIQWSILKKKWSAESEAKMRRLWLFKSDQNKLVMVDAGVAAARLLCLRIESFAYKTIYRVLWQCHISNIYSVWLLSYPLFKKVMTVLTSKFIIFLNIIADVNMVRKSKCIRS